MKIVRRVRWNETFEGWSVKFLKKNFWRVQSTMEWEDAMQECRWVFCHVLNKYEGRHDGPKHVMALYKVAVSGHFHDLSTRDTRRRGLEHVHHSEAAMEAADATTSGDLDNDGAMLSMLSKLPEDVRDTIRILYDAPAEVLELVCSSVRTGRRVRAANRVLREMTGREGAEDIVAQLRKHFAQN